MDGYLAARDLLAETLRTYAGTFERLIVDLGGDRFLGGVGAEELTGLLSWRWGTSAVGTYKRLRAALGSLWSWADRQGKVAASPVAQLERRAQRRTARQEQRGAVADEQLAALWGDPAHDLCDRTLWALLDATSARAEGIVGLDVCQGTSGSPCGRPWSLPAGGHLISL